MGSATAALLYAEPGRLAIGCSMHCESAKACNGGGGGGASGQLLLAFFYFVDSIGGQIGECFHLPGGPNNLGFVDAVMGAKPEVNAKVMLREIAAAAQHFTRLNEISGSRFYACV